MKLDMFLHMYIHRDGASNYLKKTGEVHGTVTIDISVGKRFIGLALFNQQCIVNLSAVLSGEQVKVHPSERHGGAILAMTMSRSTLSTPHRTETKRQSFMYCFCVMISNYKLILFQIREQRFNNKVPLSNKK